MYISEQILQPSKNEADKDDSNKTIERIWNQLPHQEDLHCRKRDFMSAAEQNTGTIYQRSKSKPCLK